MRLIVDKGCVNKLIAELRKELNELKFIIANFFAQKAISEADKIWDEKNLSHQEMEKLST
jgi:hypothetical protein